jgi:hypothetical protein
MWSNLPLKYNSISFEESVYVYDTLSPCEEQDVDQLRSLIGLCIEGGGYPRPGSLQTTFCIIRPWNTSVTVISDYTPLISQSRLLKSLWDIQMYIFIPFAKQYQTTLDKYVLQL